MTPTVNTRLIDLAADHACFSAELATELRRAARIIDQLAQPLLAFGEPVCRLCGESPADNNLLRGALLEQHIRRPVPDPTEELDNIELVEALRRANATIAARNHEIRQLRQDTAA